MKREPSSDVIWGYLGTGYARLHEFGKSAQAYQKAAAFSPVKVGYQAATAYALAMNGETDRAREIVEGLERKYAAGTWVPGEAMSVAYLGLGDRERAFVWLQRGVEDRSITLFEANTDPIYTAFSDDRRFQSVIERLRRPR